MTRLERFWILPLALGALWAAHASAEEGDDADDVLLAPIVEQVMLDGTLHQSFFSEQARLRAFVASDGAVT
jgi:hypothetical protein